MASLKSKIFNFIVCKQYLLRGQLRKEHFNDNTSIQAFRDRCEKGADKYAKIPPKVEIKKDVIDGINAEWLIPEGADPSKVIMYVHGGGYVSGSCNDHRGFVAKFANNVGVINLTYEYRLAPEHPFPAALDDSVLIYQNLLSKGFQAKNIIIAGESAGGGLCLAILLALKERNLTQPKAALSISPWTDLSCSSESYKTKNKVSPAPLDSWFVFSKHYCGVYPNNHPLISPLFGNLEGLPPIFIVSGVNDELYEDGEKFYHKAKEAGVDVKFKSGEGMLHCYPLLAPFFPEATEAMNEIVQFVKKHLQIK